MSFRGSTQGDIDRDFSNDNTFSRLPRKPLQVSFTVEHTDATQIFLEVTVSSPATVWCGAWSLGELIDFISLQHVAPGLQINRRREYKLSDLNPATTYEVTCIGSHPSLVQNNPYLIKQMVMTKPAYFVIRHGSVSKGSVRLRVDSNLDLPFQCVLFNSRGIQISNNTYSPRTTDCLFLVDENQLLFRVQCVASHLNGQIFAKTNMVRIEYVDYTWIRVTITVLIVLILVLVVVAVILWRKASVRRSMFELSDGEIETLLKKSMDHRPIRRTVHNDFNPDGTAGIRCKKCGFMNPATATVCVDCNSLLRGNELFSSLASDVY
ncbi:hypothetical protein WA588_002431 [Blastocystis sp. NMH]